MYLPGCRGVALLAAAAWLAGCATQPAPDALVSGSASTRQRQYIPPEAQFDAVLLDATDPARPPLVLAQQHLDSAGPPPYALHLPYRRTQATAQGRYEVRARVTLHGRLLLDTPGVHRVLVTPEFRHIDVILAPVAQLPATAQATVPLRQTYWRLQDIADADASHAPAATTATAYLVLDSAGMQASGSGGCNRFVARYAQDGGALHFAALSTSLRLCLDSGARETAYLQRLLASASFLQQGRLLELRDSRGKPLLRFTAEERGGTTQDAAPVLAPQ